VTAVGAQPAAIGAGAGAAIAPGRHRGRSWRRIALVGLGAALVASVGIAIAQWPRPDGGPGYVTAAVTRGDLRLVISATGRLQASTTVEVGAEVSGRVTRVPVEANDRVVRGQVLAELDPEQLQAALDQARAQAQVAHANARQARATQLEQRQVATRSAGLAAQQLLARQTLETAEAAAARADAAYEASLASARLADAAVTAARSRLERAVIRAPIDGMVLARLVDLGQTVTAGFSTPVLFKVAEDLAHMTLKVDVDEADIGQARAGQEATFTVDAYPQRVFQSRVTAVRHEPTIAQNVVTYEVLLTVDNADLALRPGMTASASLVVDLRRQVLVVPNAALRFLPPGAAPAPETPGVGRVWVPAASGTGAEPREVKVRASDGTSTELAGDGLAAGTRVIVDLEPSR
jgi:HlyD family secretion protein